MKRAEQRFCFRLSSSFVQTVLCAKLRVVPEPARIQPEEPGASSKGPLRIKGIPFYKSSAAYAPLVAIAPANQDRALNTVRPNPGACFPDVAEGPAGTGGLAVDRANSGMAQPIPSLTGVASSDDC